MNLAKLRGALKGRGRLALGALGVVAVAALAWRARTEKGTSSSAPASDVTQPAGTSATPSYYTGATGSGAYDSTQSDLYNALADLASRLPVPGTPTTPAEAPAPTEESVRADSITSWYQQYLGRQAAPSEIAFWNAKSTDLGTIRAGIAGSPEAAAVKDAKL